MEKKKKKGRKGSHDSLQVGGSTSVVLQMRVQLPVKASMKALTYEMIQ